MMNNNNFLKTTFLFFLLFVLTLSGSGCGGSSGYDENTNNDIQKTELASEFDSVFPESYDLRDYDRITSVKNQGQGETCWAFSAMGAMESNYLTQGLNTSECGKTPYLSAMHHAWFIYKDPEEGHSFQHEKKNVLLEGGNSLKSIAFLSRLAGPVNESSLEYPNIGLDPNDYQAPVGKPTDYKRVLRLKEAYYFNIKNDDNTYINDPITKNSTMDIIKSIVMKNGAVEIQYIYEGSEKNKEYYYNSKQNPINHRVLIVGWNDNLSREKFSDDEAKRPIHDGAWLIKDSHGKDSHNKGYFWMSYEQFINPAAAYIIEPLNENLIHYGWDDLGYKPLSENAEGLGTTGTTWVANVFQAKNNELIKEIGFYTLEHKTLEHGSTYELFIYDLGTEKPSSPTDGNIIARIDNKNYEIAGYHSMTLDTSVKIEANHYFSIVLKVISSLKHPIALEGANGAIAHEGESYFSSNAIEWEDLKTINVCLKAFTTKLPNDPIDTDDENGKPIDFDNYEVVTSTNTQWTAPNVYAVTNNVTISDRIKISGGEVQLILCDGCTLTAEKGIEVPEGCLLVIRGQSQNTGTLKATSYNTYAAIGGAGNITITGGTIIAESKNSGAGIGGNANGKVGEITILGGNVTAKSAETGAGIGSGAHNSAGKITIKGGIIYAEGGYYRDNYKTGGRGIGGGPEGSGGDIRLLGGTITAYPGIGNGENSDIYHTQTGTLRIDGEVDYFEGSVYVKDEYITCNHHYFRKGKCVWCGHLSDEKIEINANYFPDQIFRNYVNSNFDTDKDGYLSIDEIIKITKLDISNKNISNVKGIEYFTELTTFICDNNQLTELDISNSKQLRTLSCQNNQLTELNISKNSLWEFDCSGNKLTKLDIRPHIYLKALDCSENQLEELNIRQNTALRELDCSKNQLTKLDVSSNTTLQVLLCGNNSLTQLDVSKNSALKRLSCYYNEIEGLDLSNNSSIERLTCNNNKLTELNINNNTALFYLWCNNNQLKTLDIRKNTALEVVDCSSNQLSDIDVSKNTKLREFYCNYNQLNVLDVSNHTALIYLDCGSNTQLKYLNASGCIKLQEIFTSFEGNDLHSINLNNCSSLEYLEIPDNNNLLELKISGCNKIKELNCSGKKIAELDLSGCTKLKVLDCENNQLTSLIFNRNTALETLYCGNNKLAELNVSTNTALKLISCINNVLRELNVSKNTNLETLECPKNQLTSLILGTNYKLQYLDCKDNQLTNVDTSGCRNLKAFLHDNFGQAQEQLEQYTIKYNLNNANNPSNPISYTRETETITLNNPNRSGYQFDGWTGTGLSGKTQTVTIPKGSSGNREYTANFSPVTYTLSYILNGGTNNANNPTSYTIESATITLQAPTKASYNFMGWTYNGQVITDIRKGSTGNKTLTATWEGIQSEQESDTKPIISSGSYTLTAYKGQSTSLTINATGENIEWSTSGALPEGLTYNANDSNKLVISGTISNNAETKNYKITISATNNAGTDSKEISITVRSSSDEGGSVPSDPIETNADEINKMTPEEITETFSNTTDIILTGEVKNLSEILEALGTGTTVKNLDLSQAEGLTEVKLDAKHPIESLTITGNKSIKTIEIIGNTALKTVNAQGCETLKSVTIENSNNLQNLDVSETKITSLNVDNCSNLTIIQAYNCENLDEVNLTNCETLKTIDVSESNITSLNTKGCTSLENLNCASCNIKYLTIDEGSNIQNIDCSNNSLTRLDASSFSSLKELNCYNQQVTSSLTSTNFNMLDILFRRNAIVSVADENEIDDGDIANVIDLKAYDESGKEISLTYNDETGEVMLSQTPAELKYNYITGFNNVKMDVTVSTVGDTEDSVNNNGTSGGGGCHMGFWYGILFALVNFFINYKFKM